MEMPFPPTPFICRSYILAAGETGQILISGLENGMHKTYEVLSSCCLSVEVLVARSVFAAYFSQGLGVVIPCFLCILDHNFPALFSHLLFFAFTTRSSVFTHWSFSHWSTYWFLWSPCDFTNFESAFQFLIFFFIQTFSAVVLILPFKFFDTLAVVDVMVSNFLAIKLFPTFFKWNLRDG